MPSLPGTVWTLALGLSVVKPSMWHHKRTSDNQLVGATCSSSAHHVMHDIETEDTSIRQPQEAAVGSAVTGNHNPALSVVAVLPRSPLIGGLAARRMVCRSHTMEARPVSAHRVWNRRRSSPCTGIPPSVRLVCNCVDTGVPGASVDVRFSHDAERLVSPGQVFA